jgi:glycosyltransferase involved in cell wall biosynthesis
MCVSTWTPRTSLNHFAPNGSDSVPRVSIASTCRCIHVADTLMIRYLAPGTTAPLVSVVIPCYSVPAGHFRQAIDSVIAQSIVDWEAIVVDDGGSEFDLAAVVSSIEDTRIRVVKHSRNRGLGAARNTGFRNARATLVAMLDADDRLHPDYLRIMTDAIQDTRDGAWVWPDIKTFGDKPGEWRFPDPPAPLCAVHMDYRGGSSLIPANLWEAVGGFVEDPLLEGLEDLDFWLGALEVGAYPIYVHELLYQWRVSSDSMTFRFLPDSHLKMEEIYRRRRPVFEGASPCPHCSRGEPGSIFRARGYFNSSVYARRSGNMLRGLRFGLRAWFLNPSDAAIRRHLARLIVPDRVRKLWKRAD